MLKWSHCFLTYFFKNTLKLDLRKYQPSGEGATCSLPAMPLGGPKMADGVWKDVNLKVFDRSRQFSLNKFCIQAGWEKKTTEEKKREKRKQAGAELCQAQQSLSQLPPALS